MPEEAGSVVIHTKAIPGGLAIRVELRFDLELDRPNATLSTPPGRKELNDCTYRNTSDRMVILRCCGTDQFFLERVVFPFEILAFACPPMSEVKIWTHGLYGPELLESFLSEALLADLPAPLAGATGGMFPSASSTLETTPWLKAS